MKGRRKRIMWSKAERERERERVSEREKFRKKETD